MKNSNAQYILIWFYCFCMTLIAVVSEFTNVQQPNDLTTIDIYVDCNQGSDDISSSGEQTQPFRTLPRAQQYYRSLRKNSMDNVIVHIKKSVCELANTLILEASDSFVKWSADPGTLISAGTRLQVDTSSLGDSVIEVDLHQYGFTSPSQLGQLTGRGYAGGSACIEVNNFMPSAAELFYRPSNCISGVAQSFFVDNDDASFQMQLARYPNSISHMPELGNWLKVKDIISNNPNNHTFKIDSTITDATRLKRWKDELQTGGSAWTHGLWRWNWADSHREIFEVNDIQESITIGNDAIGRDVDPINKGTEAQGGNFYVYNVKSELDAPGEYYINRSSLKLSFLPPRAALQPSHQICFWNVTVSRSDHGPNMHAVVPGSPSDTFYFDGSCSNNASFGPMVEHCTKDLHVPAGAELMKRSSDGMIVGEGVCCNSIKSSVTASILINCSNMTAGTFTVGSFHVSRLNASILARNAQNVTFLGMDIRHSRGAGVVLENCTNILVQNCTIADNGMMGMNVSGGYQCGLLDSDVASNGDGGMKFVNFICDMDLVQLNLSLIKTVGIILNAGDRANLVPARHFVNRSTSHFNQRWIMNYAPNIMLAGVGNSISRSKVYNSPQTGLFYQGNDHTTSFTQFHHLAQQCSDCGAFYAGRDWTYRGNSLLNNTWSNISPSIFSNNVMTIYLDDQLSSLRIFGNIFNETGNVLQLGGGRNNEFTDNIVYNSNGIAFDNRGGGGNGCASAGHNPYDFLGRVPYNTSEIWFKYPNLRHILQDDPCLAKYNNLSNNVICGGGGASSNFVNLGLVNKCSSIAENNIIRETCTK